VKDCGAVGDGVVDDTLAIQTAFAAGMCVFFPTGVYKTTSPIQIGDGNARCVIGESRYSTKIENAVTDVFHVGNTNDASLGSIEEMTISGLGGGHCFEVKFSTSLFSIRRCTIKNSSPDKCLWHQVTGYSGGHVVEQCHLIAAANGTMTINPWYVSSNEIVNGFVYRDSRCDYSRDGFQFFKIDTTNTSSFITNGRFENLTFELTYGGMIWLGACRGVEINDCAAYDMTSTQTGHGIRIGRSTGNLRSSRCRIKRVGRYTMSSTLGAGIADIKLESGAAANVTIESCCNSSAGVVFTVDYGNNKVFHIDRPSNSEASYSNDGNVRYIDINGDFEGIVMPRYYTSIAGPFWSSGAGTPEGSVVAPVGAMYTDANGSAGNTFYVKESGGGNTGWVAK